MRVEYVNTVTGEVGAQDLPPMLNPVRAGNHPKCHVVLNSPYVGPEAVAVDNDVAGGEGWRFWNRNGKTVRVGATTLTDKNSYARATDREVVVECWPYVLTFLFAAEEQAGEADAVGRWDKACADLVRGVHRGLLALHAADAADPAAWLADNYLYEMETQILALAAEDPRFPPDDVATTDLGTHLAGVAVRSELVRHVSAKVLADAGPGNPWGRLRTALPDQEADLAKLVAEAEAALNTATGPDLSAKVERIDAGFWPFWREKIEAGRVPPRTRRYLALRRLIKEVKDVWYGFGPLEDLLEDPTVTEIMTLGADHIYVEKNGRIERSGRRFLTDPLTVIQRIMNSASRQINAAQPLADARLPDGSRVNAIIPPLSLSGPVLTIRRFPKTRLTVDDLVGRLGSLSQAAKNFLEAAVVNRRNVIVSGGTGTGKTTMLNCLSGFIPPKDRIVTIEDTAELRLQKDHVVTLQARPANVEGAGAVPIRELVKNALRMRPDRIVVGECRGGEAIDMLQAMNTGHDGSMTTLHANDPEGVVHRLVVLVQQAADSDLPVDSIRQQIVSAVDLIVQLGVVTRSGEVRRVVTEIAEVAGYDADDGRVRLVPLFVRADDGEMRPTGSLPSFLPNLIAAGLVPDPVKFLTA